jgi:hypothetical protein
MIPSSGRTIVEPGRALTDLERTNAKEATFAGQNDTPFEAMPRRDIVFVASREIGFHASLNRKVPNGLRVYDRE